MRKNALLLLFNHTLTPDQETDARATLSVSRIIDPPEDIRDLWANVPPDIPGLDGYLEPVRSWLTSQAGGRQGDYLLVQGDFGATYLMVRFALGLGLVPVYATTRRCAEEELQPDGTVRLIHRFKHVRYRKYGG
jgi:hypothetical protein